MDPIKLTVKLTKKQVQGLDHMRELNKAFLGSENCSYKVREFLEKTGSDNDLMLAYLKAQKDRPDHAWEILKKQAEVRFDQYPEVYIQKPARFHEDLQEIGLWGVLQNRDRHDRRVICCRGCKWDTNVYNSIDLTNGLIQLTQKLIEDEDAINNGIIFVGDAGGMGVSYSNHFVLEDLLRLINTLWISCPLEIHAIYYVNIPFYLSIFYNLVKPFLPKKLKERVFLASPGGRFVQLHANIDKEILPEYLGGELKYSDAFEFVKF